MIIRRGFTQHYDSYLEDFWAMCSPILPTLRKRKKKETAETLNLSPIRFSVIVPLEPADAFDLFTTRMGKWWPLIDYSISTTSAVTCVVEAVPGRRVYEIARSGEIHLNGWPYAFVERFAVAAEAAARGEM